jgi:hypothetical protein
VYINLTGHQEGCYKRWEPLTKCMPFFIGNIQKASVIPCGLKLPYFNPKTLEKNTINESDINKDYYLIPFAKYSLLDLKNFIFQFLGIFYLALAVLLVLTNIGRNGNQNLKKPGESIDCVQIVEGRGVKCHLVTDQGIGKMKFRFVFYQVLSTKIINSLLW